MGSRWLRIDQVPFCLLMDRDEVEVHKITENERGQYTAILTKNVWSIKDLLFGFRENFSCGTRHVVPSGQDSSILPARVANHSPRFGSSYRSRSWPYNNGNYYSAFIHCRNSDFLTSLMSLSWCNSRDVKSTMASVDSKFDDFCLQC